MDVMRSKVNISGDRNCLNVGLPVRAPWVVMLRRPHKKVKLPWLPYSVSF